MNRNMDNREMAEKVEERIRQIECVLFSEVEPLWIETKIFCVRKLLKDLAIVIEVRSVFKGMLYVLYLARETRCAPDKKQLEKLVNNLRHNL